MVENQRVKKRKSSAGVSKKSHEGWEQLISTEDVAVPLHPREVFVGGVTRIKIKGIRVVHLAMVMDLFSRRIMGWHISRRQDAHLACGAVLMAKEFFVAGKSRFYSNQSPVYREKKYRDLLVGLGIEQHMSSHGNRPINAYVKGFFSLLSVEKISRLAYPDPDREPIRSQEELEYEIFLYFLWYNKERVHSSIDYLAPESYEQRYGEGRVRHR